MAISGATLAVAGVGIAVVGSAAARAASSSPGQPLPVTDETISVMSPADALKSPAAATGITSPEPRP